MRVAVFCSLFSVALYIYLSFHYYQLKFSSGYRKAFCSFNQLFDCNAVSASEYASLFGVPLSLFGVVLHFTLLVLFFSFFYLTDSKERLSRFSFYLSSILFFSSLVMAFISFFLMKTYCLFCVILYFLSFLQWEVLRRLQSFSKKDLKKYLMEIFHYASSRKGALTLIALPVFSFFIHKALLNSLGFKDAEVSIRAYNREWKANPFISLNVSPSLRKGPERTQAEMTVSEFADFLCVHCKNASLKLSAFSAAYSHVRMEFYNFPLDGSCNEAVSHKSGLSCRLSKAVHCVSNHAMSGSSGSNSSSGPTSRSTVGSDSTGVMTSDLSKREVVTRDLSNKAWKLHDDIFLNQDFIRKKSLSEVDEFLKNRLQKMDILWKDMLQCIESKKTQEALQAQIDLAKRANIEGTPFILVNGKRLSSAEWLPNLEAVREIILSKK